MKYLTPLLFLLCLSFWGHAITTHPESPGNYTLIAYGSPASVILLLTETGNPQNIIEFTAEHSGSSYDNFPLSGHFCHFYSSPILLGHALRTLMIKLKAKNPEKKFLSIEHFAIFIAGYDKCAELMVSPEKDKNVKDFYLDEVRKQLALYNVTAPDMTTIAGHHRLIARAARESLEPDSIERIDDVDIILLTTSAVGYEVRGGQILSVKTPYISTHGGSFQLGTIICEEHINQACHQLKQFGQIYDPVASAINTLPTVQAFNEKNEESFFPYYAKKYFLEDSLYSNIHSQLAYEVMSSDTPSGYNQTLWQEGQNILRYYVIAQAAEKTATYSLLHAAFQVLQRLGEEAQYPALPSCKLPPIHIFGELPLHDIRLGPQLVQMMGIDRGNRTKLYTQSEFHLALAKGAQRYMGLFPGLRQ